MRITCWIAKATDTHSEYVIFIAFPRQQMLHERVSMLRHTYIGCLVSSFRGPFSARKYTQWCKHSVASHWDTVMLCLTQHGRTEAMNKSQTERGKRAMISVTFLSPSKHSPLTISITAGPLIYRCIITHVNVSHHHTITIHLSYYHRRHTVSPSLADHQNVLATS